MQKGFSGGDAMGMIRWLTSIVQSLSPEKRYSIEIKEHRDKRSNEANAYCWVLIDKLAAKTGIEKSKIYRDAIREIGGVSENYCGLKRAIERLCRVWELRGLGWQYELYPSKLPGCVNATLYYGSSTYDTAQMTRLIENIVQECKAQDIETKTPMELEILMREWGE